MLLLSSDIIFVVYLYQRWIYRVDKTRNAVSPAGTEALASEASPVAADISRSSTSRNAVLEAAEAAAQATRKAATGDAQGKSEEVCSGVEGLRRRQPVPAPSDN